MSTKNTIDKAYGSIPKEVVPIFDLSWIKPIRGIKYYWYVLVRRITR